LNTNFTQQPKTNILVKKLHTLKFGPAFLAVAGPDTIKTKTLLKNTKSRKILTSTALISMEN